MSYFEVQNGLDIFGRIPAGCLADVAIADAADYGDDHFVLALADVSAAQYENYLSDLAACGFAKYADNGKDGINGDVFAATYIKEDLTLSISWMPRTGAAYLSVSESARVSPHLVDSEKWRAGNLPGAKTVLTMYQVPEYGNCYVLKLKNGHFIVNDGGFGQNFEALFHCLEEEAPAGQKPVVDAWFVSHEHIDHVGFFGQMMETPGAADRVIVNGIYASFVNSTVANQTSAPNEIGLCKKAVKQLKTEAGETTPIYRLHAGERYYFSDIQVEVLYTQEQYRQDRYEKNLNPSSTWLLYRIEGQTFLLCGDTEISNMRDAVAIYKPDFWNVDIMNVHHHGLNLYTDDLGYFKAKTLLYSTWGTYSIYWRPKITLSQNLELQSDHCEEFTSYMDGGKRFTFPYTVGTFETLTPWYQEFTDFCVARQEGWLREAGLL